MQLRGSQSQTKYDLKTMNLTESLLESLEEKENPMFLNWYVGTEKITTWTFSGRKVCRPGLIFARIFDKFNIYEDMSYVYLLGQK